MLVKLWFLLPRKVLKQIEKYFHNEAKSELLEYVEN